LNCLIKYTESFEPKHYDSPWIRFILEEGLTVEGRGKGKAIPAHVWNGFKGS